MFAFQCFLIALLTTFASSGSAPIGGYPLKYLFQRPFIGGFLCGLILGDVQKGIIIGCAMQLVYIGYFQVGGVGSMDMGIISFPCVALAIASDIDTTAAIALATGLATVFTSFLRNMWKLYEKSSRRRKMEKIWLVLCRISDYFLSTRERTSKFLIDLSWYGCC